MTYLGAHLWKITSNKLTLALSDTSAIQSTTFPPGPTFHCLVQLSQWAPNDINSLLFPTSKSKIFGHRESHNEWYPPKRSWKWSFWIQLASGLPQTKSNSTTTPCCFHPTCAFAHMSIVSSAAMRTSRGKRANSGSGVQYSIFESCPVTQGPSWYLQAISWEGQPPLRWTTSIRKKTDLSSPNEFDPEEPRVSWECVKVSLWNAWFSNNNCAGVVHPIAIHQNGILCFIQFECVCVYSTCDFSIL